MINQLLSLVLIVSIAWVWKQHILIDTELVLTSDLRFSLSQKQWLRRTTNSLLFQSPEYHLVVVSDPDERSRHPSKFLWSSSLHSLRLSHQNSEWQLHFDKEYQLSTSSATNNRSMELSEVVRFKHLLLAMCDYTGLVFKISENREVFQRYALADGDGNAAKPFKSEWATTKGHELYVGSNGLEWLHYPNGDADANPTVVHHNNEWVKVISKNGRISNVDWGPVYHALRAASNTQPPGYLWHEAVFYDEMHSIWVILPRKSSESQPYHPVRDETCCGSNLLLIANEDFSSIAVHHLGASAELDWGYTSVKKLPGSNDTYAATKVREVSGQHASKLVVFQLHPGAPHVLAEFQLSDHEKYEGLEFVATSYFKLW